MDFSLVVDSVLATFGETVSYRPLSGLVEPFDLTVAWRADQAARNDNPAAAATALVRLADLQTSAKKGDEITRQGKIYRIAENPEDGKDGAGGCKLVLRYVRDVA